MLDRLITLMPPLTNRYLTGLGSADCFDAEGIRVLNDALRRGLAVDPLELLAPALEAVTLVNSEYFRFELQGVVSADEPMLVTIEPDGTTVGLGLGLDHEHSDRKLLALVVLECGDSDGVLAIVKHDKMAPASPGTVAVVPAFASLTYQGRPGTTVVCAAFHAFGPAFR